MRLKAVLLAAGLVLAACSPMPTPAPALPLQDEPEPPKMTTTSRKMDRLKVMKSELMYWFCSATNAPASAQVTALTTKARILIPRTEIPTDSAAGSADCTASMARP